MSLSRWRLLPYFLLAHIVFLCGGPQAVSQRRPTHAIKVLALPKLVMPSEAPLSQFESAKIELLIGQLAQISQPDFGLAATMSGDAFAPVEGSQRFSSGIIMSHGLQRSGALLELVKLGPRAIPSLLKHLGDRTSTKLEIKHDIGFGGMGLSTELPTNSADPIEKRVQERREKSGASRFDAMFRNPLKTYQVTVGDVCFVAIGQIVGRSYQAVRYQPTAVVVINSTAHSPALAKEVREIWSDPRPTQRLFLSLLRDFSCRPMVKSGFGDTDDLQCNAAMRLLYYFPKQTAALISRRLDGLDVRATGPGAGTPSTDKQLENYISQVWRNGVRADEFVKSVAWSKEPEVKAAVIRVYRRATNPDVLSAAAPAVDDRNLLRDRMVKLLRKQPREEQGAFGDGYHALEALARQGGPQVKQDFIDYLRPGTIQRIRSVTAVLRDIPREWAVDLLQPYLTDHRTFGWDHSVIPGKNEPRIEIRVCDEVAEALARIRKDLHFEMDAPKADLDRQISVMRRALRK